MTKYSSYIVDGNKVMSSHVEVLDWRAFKYGIIKNDNYPLTNDCFYRPCDGDVHYLGDNPIDMEFIEKHYREINNG